MVSFFDGMYFFGYLRQAFNVILRTYTTRIFELRVKCSPITRLKRIDENSLILIYRPRLPRLGKISGRGWIRGAD